MLALAVHLAQHIGARRILLALSRDDRDHGPGSQPAFLQGFTHLAGTLVPGLAVLAPLHDLDKAQVIRSASATGIDWTRTWSCLLDHPRYCGHCPQCKARQAAFAVANVTDPTAYAHPTDSQPD